MRFFSVVLCAAVTSSYAQFMDLNRDAGVGVSAHQWSLQRRIKSGVSLRMIIRDWRENLGARVVRLNTEFTDLQFEREFIRTCASEGMTVLIAYFDNSPLGIDRYLPDGWWDKLRTIYPDGVQARTVAAQLVKGLDIKPGIDFLIERINAFKSRNSDSLQCAWASAGNDVENATEYVFYNKVGEPGRQVSDSTKYAGWSLIVDRGTYDRGIRKKLEDVLGKKLPRDADIIRNTDAAEARMQAAWGARWLSGANHGYWNKTADGRPFFGDVGLRPNAEVYTEFGVHNKVLGGRFDLLQTQPSNARILIFWPGDGDPFEDLIDVPEARRIIRGTADRLAGRNSGRLSKNNVRKSFVIDLITWLQTQAKRNSN